MPGPHQKHYTCEPKKHGKPFSNAKLANSVVLGSLAAKCTQDGRSIFWRKAKLSHQRKPWTRELHEWLLILPVKCFAQLLWSPISGKLCPQTIDIKKKTKNELSNGPDLALVGHVCACARLRVPKLLWQAAWLGGWSFHDIKSLSPTKTKTCNEARDIFRLIPTHLSETWQLNQKAVSVAFHVAWSPQSSQVCKKKWWKWQLNWQTLTPNF